MAFKPKAVAKEPEPEKNLPVFVARAKVNGERWENIGGAWDADLGDGKKGYFVKLNTIPAGAWDGSFLLMEPLPPKED